MQILKQTKTNNKNELLLLGGSFSNNPILVVGVVHGDEPQGEDFINRYLKILNYLLVKWNRLDFTVLLII